MKVSEYIAQLTQATIDAANANTKYLPYPIANVLGFGAVGDGVAYDTIAIQAAIDEVSDAGGGVIYFPKPDAHFEADPDATITVPSNVYIWGAGKDFTTIRSSSARSVKLLEIAGDNIIIEGIGIDGGIDTDPGDYSPSISLIEIKGTCDNISIVSCKIFHGWQAIWLNPTPGEVITHVHIKDNLIEDVHSGIVLGYGELNEIGRTDSTSNVVIDNNIIRNGYYQSDGIKTSQKCNDIIITNNIISGMDRDAIDLFTSGDNVIVSNNILKNNNDCGIDIKQSIITYPPEYYGYNRKMLITNNIIDGNGEHGVAIKTIPDSEIPYLVDVSHNSFTGNVRGAVWVKGKYINVCHNLIYQNITYETAPKEAILVEGLAAQITKNINVIGNQVINNGEASQGGTGIHLYIYVYDSVVRDNMIINDALLGNNNQIIGLQINGTCKNITVKDNKITGHTTNVKISSGADIDSDAVLLRIGDVEASAYDLLYLGGDSKNTLTIVDATLINAADIGVNSTDYVIFSVVKNVLGSNTTIASEATNAVAVTAYTPLEITTAVTSREIAEGELFGFRCVGSGAGQALTNAVAKIRLIRH